MQYKKKVWFCASCKTLIFSFLYKKTFNSFKFISHFNYKNLISMHDHYIFYILLLIQIKACYLQPNNVSIYLTRDHESFLGLKNLSKGPNEQREVEVKISNNKFFHINPLLQAINVGNKNKISVSNISTNDKKSIPATGNVYSERLLIIPKEEDSINLRSTTEMRIKINFKKYADQVVNENAPENMYSAETSTFKNEVEEIYENTSTTKHLSRKCNSCQSRDRAKLYSLEAIKSNILIRLNLEQPPIVKKPIHVPEAVLEKFYKTVMENQRDENLNDRWDETILLEKKFAGRDLPTNYPHVHKRFASHDENFRKSFETFDEFENIYFSTDGFFAQINSIFLFPTTSRNRHNHFEILHFQLDAKYSSVIETYLHFYIRGMKWINSHDPSLLHEKYENGTSYKITYIDVSFYRATILNPIDFTILLKMRYKIPPGKGEWVVADIFDIANFWKDNPGSTQNIVINVEHTKIQSIVAYSGINKSFLPHLEVKIKEKKRKKRSVAFDCKETDNEDRCCRYPLKVNFTSFGWNFVIAPTSFDAYFCNGECKIGFNPQHTHTYVTSLTLSASPCCSPTKMNSLSLLYFNDQGLLVWSTIPNMSVEQCSCL